MRVLITGGAGFLGSALANTLARQGHEVLALDDLSTGDPSRLSDQVLFHRGRIEDRPKLWTLLQGIECVYHLAARVLVSESILYPCEYNKVNVGGTVSLLEAMRDVGVPRLVLASSGAVYGEQERQPVTEDMSPNPQSPYAVSKLAAEYYVHTIGALWGITTIALRIFNAYGPGQQLLPAHSPVVPHFLKQALSGGSLVIFGSGCQTRDFVYVDDVIRALSAAMETGNFVRGTINVGSGYETSVNDMAQITLQITRSRSNVIRRQGESGGVSRLCADLTLARRVLHYAPQVTVEEGVRRMLTLDPRFR